MTTYLNDVITKIINTILVPTTWYDYDCYNIMIRYRTN